MGDTYATIMSGGRLRRYVLHIPPSYDGNQATPLIFSLHGFSGSASNQEYLTRWDQVADTETLIVVYPNGTGLPLRWNSGKSRYLKGTEDVDDVAFFSDLLNALTKSLSVNPPRVHVTAISDG